MTVLYDYDRADFDVSPTPCERSAAFVRKRLEYDSLAPSRHPEADGVVAHLFESHERRSVRPVIFLHGMGKYSYKPLLAFPRKLAERGVPSVFLTLPLHFERAPKGAEGGQTYMFDDLDDTLRNFRQAVVDVRSCLDFMEDEGFVADGFTLLGISFGGMIATIAMGVDKRIQNAVLCVTGGNLMHILWHSIMTRGLRSQGKEAAICDCGRNRCRRRRRGYREYLNSLDSPEDLDRMEPPMSCFWFDPLTFARFIRGREVVMYNAMFDPIVPHRASHELWEELGCPERHFMLCEHNTIVLYRRTIVRRTAELARKSQRGVKESWPGAE